MSPNVTLLVPAMREIGDKYHNKIMGQKRKYTGENYTVHPDAVELKYQTLFPQDIVGRGMCQGHDLFEDTPLTPKQLLKELEERGVDIEDFRVYEMIGSIIELTDVFTKERFPTLNRAERKKLERERVGKISIRGKNGKLCDFLDNTESIVAHDKDFAKTYLNEKWEALPYLRDADQRLWEAAYQACMSGMMQIGLKRPLNPLLT
jgi:hypothetical protein